MAAVVSQQTAKEVGKSTVATDKPFAFLPLPRPSSGSPALLYDGLFFVKRFLNQLCTDRQKLIE
ncbi:uncharacterized protein [Physcomitrium patens]|uniref:uncharacterized protein n=1 Tax=Physcomitrium patens TaxID=3218 RepID=UPI003CCCA712